MAKDKNHSSKNQNHKNHRNGIKKPANHRYTSLAGLNQRFLRNRRRAFRNEKHRHRSHYEAKKLEAYLAREEHS